MLRCAKSQTQKALPLCLHCYAVGLVKNSRVRR